MASYAWGQHPPPRGVGVRSPRTTTEPALGPPSAAPPIAAYPLENRNRQWDLITSFSPALTLYVNRPSYQLSAGYLFTFAYSRNSNLIAPQGFSSRRQESWSNTFTPGMNWRTTPGNTLSLSATYGNLTHTFTPRFAVIIGFGFMCLDSQEQQESKTHTHTLTLGFSYLLTPTRTATISGGPAITELGGDTFVSPIGTAILVRVLPFGSASLQYARGISVAGGFGGTTDTQTVSGTLTLLTLQRGLFVVLSPTYIVSESVGSRQTGQVDV